MGQFDLFRKIAQSSLSVKQRDVNLMKSDLISDFEDTPSLYNVLIEGVSKGIHIINTIKPEEKKIFSKPDESFSVGNIIDWNSSKWLITKLDADNQVQAKGNMFECNNTLSYYSYENSILYSIPCIVSSQISLTTTLSTDQNKYLEVLSNEIFVRISDNSNTSSIKVNDKFKLGRYNYEIESLSDIVEPGLLIIKLRFISDEVVLPLFELEILNGENIQVNKNDSLTINAQVKNNGEVVNPTPSITYSSSNETIATINASTGVVNILGIGSVVFTAKLTSDLTVLDTISIEIVEVAIANKTVQISGSTSIIKGYTEDYSCVFKNNGITYLDTSLFYLTADDGVSATTLAQITAHDSIANTCTLSGVGLGYVKLWVKNSAETVVSEAVRIKIENLF